MLVDVALAESEKKKSERDGGQMKILFHFTPSTVVLYHKCTENPVG